MRMMNNGQAKLRNITNAAVVQQKKQKNFYFFQEKKSR